MSKPKWQDVWEDAFESGFDKMPGERVQHPLEKKAVAVRHNPDGTTEVVKTATGVEAMKMIAEAEASGLSVNRDTDQVEDLMSEQNGATDVPPEIYQLMSAVIGFAQELNEEWRLRNEDSLLDSDSEALETNAEFIAGDVKELPS